MLKSVVNRTQKRGDRKQLIGLGLLLLGVAVAGFALGYSFGRKGGQLPTLAAETEKPRLPVATQVVPPPPAAEETTTPEKLTFYDNLPKGDQAPLGSGINLPPPVEQAETQTVDTVLEEASDRTPATASSPAKAKQASSPPASLPKVAAQGAFVVQVASFQTEKDARKLVERLEKLDFEAHLERADLGDKGVWYRVLSGPYAERQAADTVAGRLKDEQKFSALVRRR